MKNYIVSIINCSTQEKIVEYNIEEESFMLAQIIAKAKYKREFPTNKEPIKAIAKETTRKLILIQQPKLWEYEIN